MEVTAVIPTWNGRARLTRLLPALRQEAFNRIIVVDDGSDDDSASGARSLGAEVIRFEKNGGFARSVNAGIQAARTEAIAVLNDDVELGAGWLRILTNALAANPQASFATGKILSAADPGRIDGAFDLVARSACAWRAGAGHPDGPLWQQRRTISSAPLTAVLFRAQLFGDAGLLDERLESYLEDVDFGLRCASLGHTGVYVPEAVSLHQGSATLGRWNARTVRNIARNQVILVAKHFSSAQLLRYGWQIALGQLLWGGVAMRHGALLPWVKGKWEGLRRFHGFRGLPLPDLDRILRTGEQQIREIQQAGGQDLYWRIYFGLSL